MPVYVHHIGFQSESPPDHSGIPKYTLDSPPAHRDLRATASALDFAARTRRGIGIFAPFHPAYRNIIANSFHHQWMTCRPSEAHVMPARPSQNFKIFSQFAREHVIIRLEASSSLKFGPNLPCTAESVFDITGIQDSLYT